MKVCVTGSEGFLGKNVVKALKVAGHTVVCLDVSPQAEIVADITKIIPLMKVDAVIHLAAMANPRLCDQNPDSAFAVNVLGTQQVLRLALESGAKKFVFSSSAHVYDIPPKYLPTDETHPLRLNNTYTTTKILGEQLCQLYFENHGLSYTVLRLFNAYGPNQQLGYLIPDLICKAQRGKIDLQGSDITKDWVYVTDVADAFVKAVSSDFVGAINIGTGIETSLGAIASIIAKASKVELATFPAAIPTRMCGDWHRAERILGWSPKVCLEEGLRRLLQVPVRTVAKVT